MAFDANRGVLVMFGGDSNTNGSLGDTWEWDGSRWTRRDVPRDPPSTAAARAGAPRLPGGRGHPDGAR